MSSSNSEASCSSSTDEKRAERLERLKKLHQRRNEARAKNHQEVVEEDKRSKLPSNWESRKMKADWIIEKEVRVKEAEDKGLSYDRMKNLDIQATDAEKYYRKKKLKNPDTGFADYEQATIRHYSSLVKNIRPDKDEYEEEKAKLGDAFYAQRNTIVHGLHVDKPEAVDRMVADLEKQIEKRNKYSRRRRHDDDADIDYINERNMRFNKKLERFYGQYTTEIKQNLERGTAV
nr:EOG090X0ECA [Lepidurus arcticus]